MTTNSRDDEQWLAALAGRTQGDSNSTSALEASLLRAAIQRLPEVPSPVLTSADEQRLLRALQLQGAQRPRRRGCWACAERWRAIAKALSSLPTVAVLTSAGVGLILVGSLWMWQPSQHAANMAPPPMRSPAEESVSVRVVARPLQQRNQTATELAAMGADVQRFERLGRFGLDARFVLPLPNATREALSRAQLVVSAQGEVRIEFEAQLP
jgi:hypothetical protein